MNFISNLDRDFLRNRIGILDWIYPRKCALCGFLSSKPICAPCESDFEPANEAQPIDEVEKVHSIYRYNGRAAQAVRRLKYERSTSLAGPMAKAMADAIDMEFSSFDLIVPVPIHISRRRVRGFNQSELLCEAMNPKLYEPSVLKRKIATRPQVGLSTEQRKQNLLGAFEVSKQLNGERIILVDDVATSGSTATECAQCLLAAGASGIMLLTFARG